MAASIDRGTRNTIEGGAGMLILSWNIRAGGGRRCHRIAAQIAQWRPDVAVLSEFRATAPSRTLAGALAEDGLAFQRHSADPADPARNALLVASRWPLRRLHLRHRPRDPNRFLAVGVGAPGDLAILALHVPNRSSGRKYPFLQAVTRVVDSWRGRPALLVGDTNSGRIHADEEAPAFNRIEDDWIQALEARGWRDAFRARHGARREFTWYSPNGRNGFRLDQGFLHPRLARRLRGVSHRWGSDGDGRRDQLSDHAALLVELDLP